MAFEDIVSLPVIAEDVMGDDEDVMLFMEKRRKDRDGKRLFFA
jgi:hypothetical protein